MTLATKPATYKKLKGGAGVQGTDYQLKLLEYFLLQGFYNEGGFLLSTEDEEAGLFDDIIYQTQERTLLIQAKHTCRNISFDQLLSPKSIKGDFNLYKYLKTFSTIVNNFGSENIHVIICTNSKFNEEKINDSLNQETKTNNSNYLKNKSFNFMSYINNIECYYFDSNQLPLLEFFSKNISEIPEKDIQLFLNKLLLVSLSDKDLDNGINLLIAKIDFIEKINLAQVHNTIFNKTKAWFQSDKGIYLTQNNALAYLSGIVSQNYIQGKLNTFDLLKDEKFDNNYCLELSSENLFLLKIQNIETYDLHEFKIHQFLLNNLRIWNNEIDKEKLQEKILFIDPYASENITTSIIESFKMPEYVYLVLPIFELEKGKKIQNILNSVIEVQKNKQYKKIILVAERVEVINTINQFLPNIKNVAMSIKLNNFSETIRNQILQQEIKFQGNKIPFKKIIDDKNVNINNFIDEYTLFQLVINRNEIVVNNNVKTYEEVCYYVNRQFNKTDEKLNPLTKFKYTEKDFSKHILKQCKNKFIVIFDSPGMGKSTILNKLDYLLRAEPFWVFKVNLNDCTKILWKLQKEKRNLSLQEFLNLIDFSQQTELESKIFHIPENVVLLLDALDEISPDYTDLILNSLSSIAKNNNIKKIVITSRTHVVKHFKENNIECDTFALVAFTKEEIVYLLSKFWQKELNDLDKITQFAKNLVDELNKKGSWKEIETLIGIPLQTKMVGDIFMKYCMQFLENPKNTVELPEILNLSWLYHEFIERKKEIYTREKSNADGNVNTMDAVENQFEDAINEHIKYALKLEFPEKHHNFFEILDTPRRSKEKIFLKIGILIKSDDKIQFVHKTLSEYFATRYICELVLKNDISEELWQYLVRSDFLRQNMFIKYILENKSIPHAFKNDIFNSINRKDIQNLIRSQPEFSLSLITKSNYEKLFEINCAETLHFNVGLKHRDIFLKIINEIENFDKLQDAEGNTPLQFACIYNSKEVVELLINKGHSIDVRDLNGRTPLHEAVEWRMEIVELLIDKGHPINVKDYKGRTPLHYAIMWGKTAVVNLLIDKGHPIDVHNKVGRTPLHYAVLWDKSNIVQLLIDKGHPIDARSEQGNTPLHDAAYKGNMTIVQLLIDQGHPIDVRDNYSRTLLHEASFGGKKNVVEFLLDKGHLIDVRDIDGRTPLHNAAKWGKIVEYLIDKGHPIDVRDNYGRTPLNEAAHSGKTATVELLLDKGHPIDGIDNYGKTPLHAAARWGRTRTVEFLLNKGHPIDVRDIDGKTPLHNAAKYGNKPVVECLIDKGHSIDVRDNDGRTPLNEAACSGKTTIVELLIDKGHPVDVRDNDGKTLLHDAAYSGERTIIKLLIDKGHSIKVRDKNGATPLDYAVKHHHAEIENLLKNEHKVKNKGKMLSCHII